MMGMMDFEKINNKIDELSKSGQYSDAQLEAIKYACHIPNFDETLIMDPSIPSEMMITYVELAIKRKIDISKYIKNKWHLKGFNVEQLYYIILHDSRGYDISKITPNMSVEEIIKFINNIIDENRKKELLNKDAALEYPMLKNLDLNLNVLQFFLRQIENGYDISIFLKPNIKDFSFEQIKYLFAVYDTGYDIEKIFNPNLSVEQMKEKVLSSESSIKFMQEIIERNKARKNK